VDGDIVMEDKNQIENSILQFYQDLYVSELVLLGLKLELCSPNGFGGSINCVGKLLEVMIAMS